MCCSEGETTVSLSITAPFLASFFFVVVVVVVHLFLFVLVLVILMCFLLLQIYIYIYVYIYIYCVFISFSFLRSVPHLAAQHMLLQKKWIKLDSGVSPGPRACRMPWMAPLELWVAQSWMPSWHMLTPSCNAFSVQDNEGILYFKIYIYICIHAEFYRLILGVYLQVIEFHEFSIWLWLMMFNEEIGFEVRYVRFDLHLTSIGPPWSTRDGGQI